MAKTITLRYQGQPDESAASTTERASGRSIRWSQIIDPPATYPPAEHNHAPEDIPGLAAWVMSQVTTWLPGVVFQILCREGTWGPRGLLGSLGGRRDVVVWWVATSPTDPMPPTDATGAIPGHDMYVPFGGVPVLVPGVYDPGRIDFESCPATWDVARAAAAGRIDFDATAATWAVARSVPPRLNFQATTASWAVTRVADATKPKGLLGGTMGRSLADSIGIATLIDQGVKSAARPRSTVIEVDWDAIQTSRGTLVTSKVNALKTDIGTARTRGWTVLLRIFGGTHAPQWVKDQVGILGYRETPSSEPYWYTNDGADGDTSKPAAPSTRSSTIKWYPLKKPMPNWCHPLYSTLCREFTELLSNAVGDEPNLVAVSMWWPMTQYAEPCIKQFSLVENRVASLHGWKKVAGVWTETAERYSLAADLDLFEDGFTAHRDLWSSHGVATACAYNPHQSISAATPPGMSNSTTRTLALMDQQVAILGTRFAILENNSVAAVKSGSDWVWDSYADMYAHMANWRATQGVRLHLQTETKVKHQKKDDPVSPLNTHLYAGAWGAMSVEITRGGHLAAARVDPGAGSGWLAWTNTDAANANDKCTANKPAWW